MGSRLPKKQLATGDYAWKDELMPNLVDAITEDVAKWIITDPPYGYDEDDADDMALWQKRRSAALLWVKSAAANKFSVWLYKQYANMFKEASTGRADVAKLLESFYTKRRKAENDIIRNELAKLLTPLEPTTTGETDVVDTYAFFVGVLLNAVFFFFQKM